jgi:3-deoxy-manno-octulosonate cytidylyltransferase (CMP-KDO synthetase)
MRILGVIPARMGATRFPGKPLADLAGRPLIQWVYEAAAACTDLDGLMVATPDADIVEAVMGFGGSVELTKAEHPTGTDRVAEVAGRHCADVVVNVQGDQPFVTPEMLSSLVAPYRAGLHPGMTTVAAPLDDAGLDDPNTVKVVCDRNGDAL